MEHKYTLEDLPMNEFVKNIFIAKEVETHAEYMIKYIFTHEEKDEEYLSYMIISNAIASNASNADYRHQKETGENMRKLRGVWVFGDEDEKLMTL